MCFSATASFTTGTLLLVTGIITLRQVKHISSLPFASIPLIFGIQQIIEGFVWISFPYEFFHSIAVHMFVFIAYVFWPIYTPISIFVLEKDTLRKKLLLWISGIWLFTGVFILSYIFTSGVTSSIVSHSICYNVPIDYPFTIFALYFFSICSSILLSSSNKVRIFWIAIMTSFFVAHYFYPETSFSVWCFFSAALSTIIYIHMKDLKKLFETKIEKIL